MVETSAPFTFLNMMVLEDLGFCAKGEGKDFVRDGGIAFDGGLPFNTNGGYLSFGQAANGMHMALEAVQQLRGEAPGSSIAAPRAGSLPRGAQRGALGDPAQQRGGTMSRIVDWSEGLPLDDRALRGRPDRDVTGDRGLLGGRRARGAADQALRRLPPPVPAPDLLPRASNDLPWVRPAAGTVYTFSTIYRAPTPEFTVPYTNGIVLLAEGVHLYGRLIGKERHIDRDR